MQVCAARTAVIDVSMCGQDGNDQSMTTTANGSDEVSDAKTRDQCSHDGSDEVKTTWRRRWALSTTKGTLSFGWEEAVDEIKG